MVAQPGTARMQTGQIKWFSPAKGYGFITKEDGSDVFVHYTGLSEGQDRKLFPKDIVQFNEVIGEKGPKAVDVQQLPSEDDGDESTTEKE